MDITHQSIQGFTTHITIKLKKTGREEGEEEENLKHIMIKTFIYYK